MNSHVLDGYQTTIIELRTPDGKPLPVIEITFTTRNDPDRPDLSQWPTLRIRPRDIPHLVQTLQTAYERSQSQDYGGPGLVQ